MKLEQGQYVRHAKYGMGTIIENDGDRTTVDFETAGIKKFVASLAVFEIAEGKPAPKKRLAGKRRQKPASSFRAAAS